MLLAGLVVNYIVVILVIAFTFLNSFHSKFKGKLVEYIAIYSTYFGLEPHRL